MGHKIVDGGVFQRDALWELIVERPARYPGSSGCRNFKDVESDLKAVGVPDYGVNKGGLTDGSVANRGQSQRSRAPARLYDISLVAISLLILEEIVTAEYGLEIVQEYMYHIRNNAEMSVRNLLRTLAKRLGTTTLSAVDYLDDGTPVGHSSPSSRQLLFITIRLRVCNSSLLFSRFVLKSKLTRKKGLRTSISKGRAQRSGVISMRQYRSYIQQ